MILTVERKSGFGKQLERMLEKGKKKDKFIAVIEKLKRQEQLPPWFRDHNLHGKWEGCRECHIEHDWLLIYKVIKDRLVLYLVSTGTHDDVL